MSGSPEDDPTTNIKGPHEASDPPEPELEIMDTAEGPSSPPTPQMAVSWEERCSQLEAQLKVLKEVSSLRKRLVDLREAEVVSLRARLKALEGVVDDERRNRSGLVARMEAAELDAAAVKDQLRRNLESLERLKQSHERRITMLSANKEIGELRLKGAARQLDEARQKNAELKGLLEELNLKLKENKKVNKRLEAKEKKLGDRLKILGGQFNAISEVLKDVGEEEEEGTKDALDIRRIKHILRNSSTCPAASGSCPEEKMMAEDDEGAELTSLELELEEEDEKMDAKENEIPGEESCYKTVDTSSGPQLILSVSRTFIKLQDLILEKRSLTKDIGNLKHLNNRLESKVDRQEHRLYVVTKELNKTWSLVSKLKLQQDKLHNNEAFLKYELKEKRALLERLKKELGSYKDKWRKVREKNSESQSVWQQLRDEFAQRKKDDQQQSQEQSTVTQTTELPKPNNSSSRRSSNV